MLLSLCRSWQRPLHSTRPEGQAQAPPWQVRPPAQALPQAPQFLPSLWGSTQSVPHWIDVASRFNPVNWGVEASRNAILTGGHWGASGIYLMLLVAATAVTSLFATWCFRSYQRSI